MEHFSIDQIVELQVQHFNNKNKGFASVTLLIEPKNNSGIIEQMTVKTHKNQIKPKK